MLSVENDVENYLRIQRESFAKLGLDIQSCTGKSWTFWKLHLAVFGTIWLVMIITHFVWKNSDDVSLVLECSAPLLEFCLILCKAWICLYKRKGMVILIRRIHCLSLKALEGEREILSVENTKEKRLSEFYFISVIIPATMALILPFIKGIFHYLQTDEFIVEPTFKGSYPFKDYTRLPNCFLVLLSVLPGAYLGAFISIATESLYCWFMYNIVAHFRILKSRLMKFSLRTLEFDIKHWILYHCEILSINDNLNDLYAPIVFAQFALNSTQIGLVAYQVTMIDSMGDLLFLLAFLSAVIVQPIIYCYGGARVENESELIAAALYENFDWNNWSINIQKYMRFVLMRAQKSCKLNGVFFTVNLTLFLWVIRKTTSYVTLLFSVR